MKRGKYYWSLDATIILLAALSVALLVTQALARPRFLIPAGIVFLIALCVLAIGLQVLRRGVRKALSTEESENGGLSQVAIPAAVVANGSVVWCNECFRRSFANGNAGVLAHVDKLLPGLDVEKACLEGGQDVELAGSRYTVHCGHVQGADGLHLLLFSEDTELKGTYEEYYASRPAVIYFTLDTYDEILKDMRETQSARILSDVELAVGRYVEDSSGFVRRMSSARYLAVVEERHAAEMMANRFAVLDEVRKIEAEGGVPVTLSIGVGRGETFAECEELAAEALEMALGRGGDQAAVKGPDGYDFYGGVTRGVEKRTKVKSRVISTALREKVMHANRVLIMGHRNSDMDSVGAAIGVLRFCRMCGKTAHIVIDREHTQAQRLLDAMCGAGYTKSFISPSAAVGHAGHGTVLVIVDTHAKHMLESQHVYEMCDEVVIIDHHRRVVGYIEDATLLYHETYASSASELVTELLMYLELDIPEAEKPAPIEAEALLAGIMLDTRTFSLHVGVRTFEAAAFLRRCGADTEDVKGLFSTSMNDYLYRSHLVGQAKIYHACAVAVSDKIPAYADVLAAQAANDLLTIEGVKASVVAVLQGSQVLVSARSMGDINVQLIMESLGGGGHLTMAGAQLKGVGIKEAEERIFDAIDDYRKKYDAGVRE